MNLIQVTPGAGAMYCGGCLRDNALVVALRRLGHQVTMVPLYLPLTLDEPDQSAETPVFYGGLNVYLEQKSALFRGAPGWLHGLLAARPLLNWAAGRAAKTRAADLGELTLSMLRGEAGNQARELDDLIAWLKTQPPPDVICLSNALLIGMVRRLKSELHVPIACALQGEDSFLDALPEPHRAACWGTLAERAREVDVFIAPSQYFSGLMQQRLALPAERVSIVPNGINLDGYEDKVQSPKSQAQSTKGQGQPPAEPTLGFFARMCPEKGLDTLVDAYLRLRQRARVKKLKLRVGGSCGPADTPLVNALQEKLAAAGFAADAQFLPNLTRADKLAFLHSLSVFSVPARYSEAFGLYVIEAMAAGIPVVQPSTSAFPELIEATGGGVLCPPADAQALAEAIEALLLDPARGQALGQAGRRAVFEKYSAEAMARATIQALAPGKPANCASHGD